MRRQMNYTNQSCTLSFPGEWFTFSLDPVFFPEFLLDVESDNLVMDTGLSSKQQNDSYSLHVCFDKEDITTHYIV